jgi:large repetitive protein
LVTARNPRDRNMLGFDIKNFDGPGILANGATSAQIDLASTSERYFPGVVTTAIDVFAPDFSPSTKSVENLTGGTPARVGDRLRYTVTFVNGGQDPAVNTSISDPLPPGATYVPNSFTSSSGLVGGYDANANAVVVASSGTFGLNASKTFSFDVDVGPDAAGADISNQATITYDGATLPTLRGLTFATRAATIAVVPTANLSISKVNSPDPVVAGTALTSTITATNDGPSPASNVVVTDELPPDIGTVTATPSQGPPCTVTTTDVSCAIGTLAPGATVTVTVVTAVPPGSPAGSLTDVAGITSDTADPDPDDNTVGATTDVARDADLSVTKTVSPPPSRPDSR